MIQRSNPRTSALLLALLASTSGAAGAQAAAKAPPAHANHDHAVAPAGVVADAGRYRVLVHRSPSCGCCMKWVAHLREAGFKVEVQDHADMAAIKKTMGVPDAMRSCHTAKVGDYFIEGHVPAPDILRLLAEAPRARGLAVPGMPVGSPGMEMPDGSGDPYTVELVGTDGSASGFARHGK